MTFVLIRDGVTVSRAIAAVAPSGFSVTAKAGARRALSVAGLQGATVTIAGTSKNVPSADPLTVEPSTDLETCRYLMRRHGFRHLPVCEQQQLKGIVSMRDILLQDLSEKDDEVRMMRAYIHSVP